MNTQTIMIIAALANVVIAACMLIVTLVNILKSWQFKQNLYKPIIAVESSLCAKGKKDPEQLFIIWKLKNFGGDIGQLLKIRVDEFDIEQKAVEESVIEPFWLLPAGSVHTHYHRRRFNNNEIVILNISYKKPHYSDKKKSEILFAYYATLNNIFVLDKTRYLPIAQSVPSDIRNKLNKWFGEIVK